MKHINRKLALLMVMCLIVTSVIAFPKSASSAGIKDLEFSNEDASGTIEVNGGDYDDDCVVRTISKIFDEKRIGVNYKKKYICKIMEQHGIYMTIS